MGRPYIGYWIISGIVYYAVQGSSNLNFESWQNPQVSPTTIQIKVIEHFFRVVLF